MPDALENNPLLAQIAVNGRTLPQDQEAAPARNGTNHGDRQVLDDRGVSLPEEYRQELKVARISAWRAVSLAPWRRTRRMQWWSRRLWFVSKCSACSGTTRLRSPGTPSKPGMVSRSSRAAWFSEVTAFWVSNSGARRRPFEVRCCLLSRREAGMRRWRPRRSRPLSKRGCLAAGDCPLSSSDRTRLSDHPLFQGGGHLLEQGRQVLSPPQIYFCTRSQSGASRNRPSVPNSGAARYQHVCFYRSETGSGPPRIGWTGNGHPAVP